MADRERHSSTARRTCGTFGVHVRAASTAGSSLRPNRPPVVTKFQAASKRLLVPVVGRKVALPDAPRAGFLAELYPDHADFALPVEDARVLSSAWEWYEQGVHFPVLTLGTMERDGAGGYRYLITQDGAADAAEGGS